ncbi:MAG: UbiA family prenyltransferase, partial [Chloroflexi bacterium]|nr:UbiA family prenyltransferase [Chloroflexota bacterium]
VLTGQYSWTAFVASLVPFFLVNNLLLLNQFPDVEADRSIGRKHFPIVIGRRASSLVYAAFMLFTYVSIVLGVYLGLLPLAALLGLLGLVLAVPACVGAYRYADDVGKLVPYLALNVLVNLITPMLVAVGLFIGPN